MPTNPMIPTASPSPIRAAPSSRRRSRSARFRRSRAPRSCSAIVTGYDVGTRVAMALGGGRFHGALPPLLLRRDFWGGCGLCCPARPRRSPAARARSPSPSTSPPETPAGCAILPTSRRPSSSAACRPHNGVKAALLGRTGIPASTEPLEGVPGLFAGYSEAVEARPRHRGAWRAFRDHAHCDQEMVRRIALPRPRWIRSNDCCGSSGSPPTTSPTSW